MSIFGDGIHPISRGRLWTGAMDDRLQEGFAATGTVDRAGGNLQDAVTYGTVAVGEGGGAVADGVAGGNHRVCVWLVQDVGEATRRGHWYTSLWCGRRIPLGDLVAWQNMS